MFVAQRRIAERQEASGLVAIWSRVMDVMEVYDDALNGTSQCERVSCVEGMTSQMSNVTGLCCRCCVVKVVMLCAAESSGEAQ